MSNIYKNVCKALLEEVNHVEILNRAKEQASNPDDIPKIETLHQNISHMTIALTEVETRMTRVVGKINRLGIKESDEFLLPLSKCIETLKLSIEETNSHLSKY
jgi:hypothetical protein